MNSRAHNAFTLVEILIVVVILGILAAIVVPNFTNAAQDARQETTVHELEKLRRAIDVHRARNSGGLPAVTAGNGTWGVIIGPEYIKAAPINQWVGGANGDVIVLGNAPDGAYQTTHGWIYNPATGDIWAGSFDANDNPLPKP